MNIYENLGESGLFCSMIISELDLCIQVQNFLNCSVTKLNPSGSVGRSSWIVFLNSEKKIFHSCRRAFRPSLLGFSLEYL